MKVMKVSIDQAGRIVLPKATRQRYGIQAGDNFLIVEEPGGVHLKMLNAEPCMIKKGGWWVHQGVPSQNAEDMVDRHREDRIQELIKRLEKP